MLAMQLGSILMFLAGIALLTALLMRRSYRYFGGKKRGFDPRPIDAQPRPTKAWEGAMNDSAAMVERQQVELAQMSRDVNGQIDTKIMILRELIARSEKQIERMEELLREMQQK